MPRKFAGELRVGYQARREGLGDRADLEQGGSVDVLAGRFRSNAVVEDVVASVNRDSDRHSGDAVLLHNGANGLRHDRLNVVVF